MKIKIETKHTARLGLAPEGDWELWQVFVEHAFDKAPESVDVESFAGFPTGCRYLSFEGTDAFDFKLFMDHLEILLDVEFDALEVEYE